MRIFKFLCLYLLLWPSLSGATVPYPDNEYRVALIIGNGAYHNAALRNPANDARVISDVLSGLGFKVLFHENLGREGMHQAIAEFGRQLHQEGVGLFYFAGHGMQIKGRNFLIPVDADIQSEDDIEFRGMDVDFILSKMGASKSRVNLLVLDACRNNPFVRNSRGAVAGLAQMDAPKGTLIAFSTAPGSLAKDGASSNSIYTRHLAAKLLKPALPIEQLFKEVRVAVARETKDKQIPWESSSLMGDFYFVPPNEALRPQLPSVNTEIQPEKPPVSERPRPEAAPAIVPDKQLNTAENRDFNREGYEIELRARHLTQDELPTMKKRAEAGDVVAQTTLGWAYLLGRGELDGRGIARSNTQMLKWTMAAAKRGHPVAQNNLGAMYMEGIGVKIDYPKAQRFFKLSADQGYLAGQRNLLWVSMLLRNGNSAEIFGDIIKGVQAQMKQPAQ